MSRSKHQHKKNYYVIIGSKNFKNATKYCNFDKALVRDIQKNIENEDVLIAKSEANKKSKKDIFYYD